MYRLKIPFLFSFILLLWHICHCINAFGQDVKTLSRNINLSDNVSAQNSAEKLLALDRQIFFLYFAGNHKKDSVIALAKAQYAVTVDGNAKYQTLRTIALCASLSQKLDEVASVITSAKDLLANKKSNLSDSVTILLKAFVLKQSAALLYYKGQYFNAYQTTKKALDLLLPLDANSEISGSYAQLAFCQGMFGTYQLTAHYNRLALKYAIKAKLPYQHVLLLSNISVDYHHHGEHDSAIIALKTALDIANSVKADLLIGHLYNGLAEAYEANHNLSKAEFYAYKSLDHKLYQDPEYKATTLSTLANIAKSKRDYANAVKFTLKALKILDSLKKPQQTKTLLQLNLVSLYALQHNYKAAMDARQRFRPLQDSMRIVAIDSKIEDLEQTLKNAKRDKEIATQQETLLQASKKSNIITALLVVLALAVVGILFLLFKSIKAQEALKKQNAIINQQNAQLSALNDTKDKMFRILSNDLRGPIGSLQSVPEIIRFLFIDKNNEGLREVTFAMRRTVNNLLELLNTLLEWASAQSGGLKTEFVKVNLNAEVNKVALLLEDKSLAKNQTIIIDIDLDMQVYADGKVLHACVKNVLSNAIKFSEKNKIITINTSVHTKGELDLVIADQGIGMTVDQLGGLFKLGIAMHRQGTDAEPGHGLGLVLVDDLIKRTSGNIKVKSTVGIGTSVTLTLPTMAPTISA